MTLAEKFRFLADRLEDGKEFYLGDVALRFDSETSDMIMKNYDGVWFYSNIKVNTIDHHDVKLKPQWEFSEDEKVILRNLPDEYRWIARDDVCDGLFAYTLKPTKFEHNWVCMGNLVNLTGFRHLFKLIKWSDDEPCEFRRYL